MCTAPAQTVFVNEERIDEESQTTPPPGYMEALSFLESNPGVRETASNKKYFHVLVLLMMCTIGSVNEVLV